MALFRIYADESGKLGKNADYTSFCGYIAHVAEWERFELEWRSARVRWQVPAIHMSRIMAPDNKDDAWKKTKEEWGEAWDAKRDIMLKDFAAIIRSAHVVCVGAVVDAAHFRSLCDQDTEFKQRFKSPAYLAFHTLVMRGIEKTEIVDKCSPIGIVIDDDQEFAMGCYDYINQLKHEFPKVRERIHSVCLVNDESYSGIQAADMIAWEARRLMVERKASPAAPPSELFQALTLYLTHQPTLYTAEVLDKLRAEMRGKDAHGKS